MPAWRGDAVLSADIVTSSCELHPELERATLGELNRIFEHSIEVVQSIGNNLRGDIAQQSLSLRQSWLDHWLPYRELAVKAPEVVGADVIEREARARVCDLVDLTENLAEHAHMADATGRVAVAYGDLLRVLADVRDRVDHGRGRRRGLRMLAIVAAGGVAVGALAYGLRVRW